MNSADVDECIGGTHNCAQNCDNTVGSYTCSCDEGYTTTDNGATCDGILLHALWNNFWQYIFQMQTCFVNLQQFGLTHPLAWLTTCGFRKL